MSIDPENPLIIRDYLARQRTRMANERTLLSYIRTSLYFLVSGTALIKVDDLENISDLGYISFAISIILVMIGFFAFFRVKRKMRKGYYHKM